MTGDDATLDLGALFTLSYGLYIVSSRSGERVNGQISNAVMQVTDTPLKVAVAVNKKALTHEFIAGSGTFGITVLGEGAPMEFIGLFGFKSGRDIDKFAGVPHRVGATGCPLVTEHAVACVEARVTCSADCGTHTIFRNRSRRARRAALPAQPGDQAVEGGPAGFRRKPSGLDRRDARRARDGRGPPDDLRILSRGAAREDAAYRADVSRLGGGGRQGIGRIGADAVRGGAA